MTPDAILAAITAVAQAATELAKFLQTAEGQEMLKQARTDRAAWDHAIREFGTWMQKLLAPKPS